MLFIHSADIDWTPLGAYIVAGEKDVKKIWWMHELEGGECGKTKKVEQGNID